MQEQLEKDKTIIVSKKISENNKTLFNFKRRQLLEEGFEMVGEVEHKRINNFWDFFTGDQKFIYTASFKKNRADNN